MLCGCEKETEMSQAKINSMNPYGWKSWLAHSQGKRLSVEV